MQPALGTAHHLALGRALAPLTERRRARDRLRPRHAQPARLVASSGSATPLPYVAEFSEWLADRLAAHDDDALVDYRARAPHAERAHPTDEHFLPLFVALGAAGERAPVAARARRHRSGGARDGRLFVRTRRPERLSPGGKRCDDPAALLPAGRDAVPAPPPCGLCTWTAADCERPACDRWPPWLCTPPLRCVTVVLTRRAVALVPHDAQFRRGMLMPVRSSGSTLILRPSTRSMARRRSRSSSETSDSAWPVAPGATGAADAMHVVFGHVRQFVIDDLRQFGDVEATRGDVGRDQHLHLVALEVFERLACARSATCCHGSRRTGCRRARAGRRAGWRHAWCA